MGNLVHVIFHESIETTLALKESTETGVEGQGTRFSTLDLMLVVEFGYINIFGRRYHQYSKAEKQLGK